MASLRGQDTDERVEGAKRSTCPAGARKEGKEEDFFLLTSRQVSLCSSGCPGTCSVNQAGLKLRHFNPLGIKSICHQHPAIIWIFTLKMPLLPGKAHFCLSGEFNWVLLKFMFSFT